MGNVAEASGAVSALAGAVAYGIEEKGAAASGRKCSFAGCESTGKIRLNGKWACGRACLEELLREAIVEEGMRSAALTLRARPRTLLGRILIEQGTITEGQLEAALRSQRATGAGRLGCWLKQQTELPESEFTAALSIQWGCPVFRVGNFASHPMAGYLPKLLIEQSSAVPLRLSEGSPERLSLCFEDHVDYQLLQAAERVHGIAVEAGLLTASDFWAASNALDRAVFPAAVAVEAASVDRMAQAMSYALIKAYAGHARLALVGGCYWLRFWKAREDVEASPAGCGAYDILCTPRAGDLDIVDAESSEAAAALGAAMLEVLQKPGARV